MNAMNPQRRQLLQFTAAASSLLAAAAPARAEGSTLLARRLRPGDTIGPPT